MHPLRLPVEKLTYLQKLGPFTEAGDLLAGKARSLRTHSLRSLQTVSLDEICNL